MKTSIVKVKPTLYSEFCHGRVLQYWMDLGVCWKKKTLKERGNSRIYSFIQSLELCKMFDGSTWVRCIETSTFWEITNRSMVLRDKGKIKVVYEGFKEEYAYIRESSFETGYSSLLKNEAQQVCVCWGKIG